MTSKLSEKITLSYIAGLTDAEGAVMIRKGKPSRISNSYKSYVYEEVFQIKMTTRDAINVVEKKFGGKARFVKSTQENESDQWVYLKANRKANRIIKDLFPLLLVKKRYAELTLKLRDSIETAKKIPRSGPFKALPKKIVLNRESLYKEYKKLRKEKAKHKLMKVKLMKVHKKLIEPWLKKSDSEVLAYLAGIIDGEGNISIKKTVQQGKSTSPVYREKLYVKMTDGHAIWLLQNRFGGVPRLKKTLKPGDSVPLEYEVTDAKASKILLTLIPYLKEKKDQAELVLSFRRRLDKKSYQSSFQTLPKEELREREALYLHVKALHVGNRD